MRLELKGYVLIPDRPENAADERAVKEECGALDMLATCSSVAGGSRWYRLDGPSYVNGSRVGVVVGKLVGRGIGASRWVDRRGLADGEEG